MNFLVQLLLWFGIQSEVKRGTKRNVLIFPKYGFALKFAIFQPVALLRLLFNIRKNGGIQYKYLIITKGSAMLGVCTPGNIEGFLENWREYRFFKKNPGPFLFPVLFSLFGIVNVLPIKDELPSDIDREKFRVLFKAYSIGDWDGHHFKNPENFCFREGYLCMTDYGSLLTQEVILQHWNLLQTLTEQLVRNHK